MKVWLVEHPLYLYKEDVKALAKEAGLQVIDAKFKGDIKKEIATDTPTLTKKTEKRIAKEVKAAQDEQQSTTAFIAETD